MLAQNLGSKVAMFSNKIAELTFDRLSIPLLMLARQLAKNVLALRSILQKRLLALYPGKALKVRFFKEFNVFELAEVDAQKYIA